MGDANSSGDSAELEALFDSISGDVGAAKSTANPVPPPFAVEKKSSLMELAQESNNLTEDSQDLQNLFDTVASDGKKAGEAENVDNAGKADASVNGEWPVQNKVFSQVGQMARQMHDLLGTLGYDKLIEKTASEMPDARDRLKYIADLTKQAADKVLNATDMARPMQEELEAGAELLATKWDALYANQIGVEDFKLLASETRAFLKNAVPQRTSATKEQLLEIMMAQDFQDLTGQVIKKIIAIAQEHETQLMSILIETIPTEKRTEPVNSLLNGPVINGEGRSDVVVSQAQVDDLLDSLGF
ncbi:MAG: protein phosphatase CheZ [Zoogloeaceae bacterium]|jgi:chemotaxis protein CheZ|nr:protein phosphatase CheZ [Zoogloeaceae bacterium]